MPALRYRIAPEVFEAHPDYVRGVLVFDRLDNRGDGAALVPLLREAEQRVRDTVAGNVAEHPGIAAWREAYRRFGAKPSEHRSSIEAMVRRVVQPGEIPSINPLVNIGNIVSLRHRLPAGVHPLGPDHERRRGADGHAAVVVDDVDLAARHLDGGGGAVAGLHGGRPEVRLADEASHEDGGRVVVDLPG